MKKKHNVAINIESTNTRSDCTQCTYIQSLSNSTKHTMIRLIERIKVETPHTHTHTHTYK